MAPEKILITGVNGFIGSHLVNKLFSSKYEIHGLGRSLTTSSKIFSYHCCDLIDASLTKKVIEKVQPSVIIHLAGSRLRSERISEFGNNFTDSIGLTLNTVNACVGKDWLKCFVTLGTCEEYGSLKVPYSESDQEVPNSAYAWGKLATTKLLMALWQTHKFPAVILRPTVAYGPNQDLDMFIPALISSLLKNQDFRMTDGSQTRDFIFIDDVISAIVRAINIDVAGQIINISSGTEVSLSTLVELVLKIIDTDVRKHVLKATLPRRHAEVGRYVATNGLAKQILGWEPTVDLESGLTQTINWYSNSLET